MLFVSGIKMKWMAIGGIALISFQEGPAHASALGVVLCLAAALAWAVYSIIVKRLSDLGRLDVLTKAPVQIHNFATDEEVTK